ncbi:MAG TPA: phospholipase D-like domain-containing protein [Xanthomonadaceae bacterium]|nr:phospholipase D-like domain-containing protein [Xanthomonadaceae bacterium]
MHLGKGKAGRDERIVIIVLLTLMAVGVAMNFRTPEKQIEHAVVHMHGIHDPIFQREMGVLMGPAILSGNKITPLENGDEIFPAMLEAIRGARRTIDFESYIYWSGEIGQEFAAALEERARAGVKVNVILDWAGSSKMDQRMIDALEHSGVKLERYHPLNWYHLARMNNRTHRKLLIVDGTVGFTGGVGIADTWTGHAQDPDHWRDMHFKVEGPVVAEMQTAFLDNWIKTTDSVLHGDDYFPQLQPVGDKQMHLFVSSPAGGSASMHLMYLLSIAAAEHSIDIEAAYFIPDDLMRDALIAARHRGVRVRVLLPDKHIDSETVRIATKQAWGPLLEAGMEFHEYEPTMLHCKMLILDGQMISVGSTNFDMRSFELNDEASLNVYDHAFGDQMTKVFEQDLLKSTPYTLQMWQDRPWTQKLAELIIRPIRSQL